MFTTNDLKQFISKGISVETIKSQIRNFETGFPYSVLVKPAVKGDGIIVLTDEMIDHSIKNFESKRENIKIVKFVPASGAASRMFKDMYSFLEEARKTGGEESLNKDKDFGSVHHFVLNLKKFAFYEELKNILKEDGIDLDSLLEKNDYETIIDYTVDPKGLNYGDLPKGLLTFHSYDQDNRKSFEEHLVEAGHYAASADRNARVHFTVSPDHLGKFRTFAEQVVPSYGEQFNVNYDISFSVQKPSTDTIAVDMDNKPFRETDGSILFRPGGHGALIENLNDIKADLIFIKNIDNVVPDRLKPETTRFKKAIGGLLLSLQAEAFQFLNVLENSDPDVDEIDAIRYFAMKKLNIDIPDEFDNLDRAEKIEFLFDKLNRPIRVCGMVKNEGEPGGGPFWVKNSKGEISLQIVESSQIDMDDPEQKKIFSSATHFNPVDLVCGTKDFEGNPFDLHKFIDPETGFISIKSKNGRSLKAQELPGLWNGAMAGWITLFADVPIITFNPVKTVNDLLRDEHQPE